MATVYLAEDLGHHRKVALKVLRSQLAEALGPERFLREIRTTASLDHPNILTLIDSGEAAGSLFYVMPYVSGESLRARLQRESSLSPADALTIVQGVASALEFAHQRGIVHRDVKPENILLHQGVPMVADFGIALPASSLASDRLTETGYSLGTPAYMSPEQVTGTREVDGRSDQYSLACVLYELLSGAPPFSAPTAQGVFVKHVTESAPPLRSLKGTLRPSVVHAVGRALAKDPAARFGSMTEFARALTAADSSAEGTMRKSLVVLPFANLSPDPDDAYFADGLMDEVIADLSKVRSLRVISRNSAIQLKGTTKDTRTIGRELDVRYVLEGTVRRSGKSVRITAQLIDAATDEHVWAEKYPGTLDDVFAMQEQLSRQIVAALQVALTPAESRSLAERPVRDSRTYDCYLRARHATYLGTEEGLAEAIEILEAGLALLGPDELLYAGLGWAHWFYGQWAIDLGPERMEKAEDYAAKIRALNPDSSLAESLTASILWRQGRRQRSVHHFKRALALDPTHSDTLCYLAYAYLLAGHGEAAGPLIERARDIDPLSLMVKWQLVFGEFLRGSPVGAIESMRALAEQEPDNPSGWTVLGWILARAGRRTEALDAWRNGLGSSNQAMTSMNRFLVAAFTGDHDSAVAALTGEAERAVRMDEFGGLLCADGYAEIGEIEASLDWLEHVTLDRGLVNYPFIMDDQFLAPLRGMRRFEDLMTQVHRRWMEFEI